MKLLIASDIHGSAYYCSELIKRYREDDYDRLLLLGDVLYHGPRNDLPRDYDPKQVARMLNEMSDEILCIRGNCDSEVDQLVLDFPIMADYAILYVNGLTVYATHGHVYNFNNLPPLKKGDILLHGHTHIPACEMDESCTYINPGSVSIPKADSFHSFIVLSDEGISYREIDGTEYRFVPIDELRK